MASSWRMGLMLARWFDFGYCGSDDLDVLVALVRWSEWWARVRSGMDDWFGMMGHGMSLEDVIVMDLGFGVVLWRWL
ncbi:hypothetical protein L873DRAFT_1807488 [Choiromyces venosus 120613-1]|uniref:Uncharacterized protein n=1 Tax=Choiromyces venosus 120613-1 TaxID=1336337 RepID=A0A3N4JYQ6_9PEZI|nr:hypothetical protein L873DRAFT_1807488 [Choiromyces venosus 120613-1]